MIIRNRMYIAYYTMDKSIKYMNLMEI